MPVQTPVMLRKALVILDLQNEFISPAGRCQITNTEVVEAIKNFATIFREQPNADVIWVRSEFKKERNANDPRNDELIICDSEEEGNTTQKQGDSRQKGNPQKGKGPSQSSRNPPQSSEKKNSTEAFLSSGEDPLCAKSTPGAEFHESIVSETQNPKDRVIVKTWYSAFKETNLERFLRGRFVCELYICGLKTNISVLATASDAVKLGLNVWVMSDCLGFTSLKLHETAMAEMVGVLGVETLKSMILIRSLAAKRKTKATPVRPASKEVSKEDLEKMLENLAIEKNARQEGDEDSLEGDVSGNDEDGTEGLQQPLLPPSPPPQEVKPQSSLLQTELVERPRSRPDKPIQQPSPIESTTVKDPEDDRTEIHAEEKPISPTTSTTTSYPRPQKQPVSRIKGLRASPTPILGEGDRIGEGDSKLIANILPKELAEDVFERLKKEVRWRTMYHRGGEVPRLVAVEGEGDGDESIPIYRHPADESPPLRPFSPTISLIRRHVQEVLKHPVNHVLIQYYRDGNDYISEHSDKTLDIVKGSMIVNVSVGAQRTMILRTKKDTNEKQGKGDENTATDTPKSKTPTPPRNSQRVPLPHNSMFVLGPATNRKWLHAIKQDKRLLTLKSPEETAFSGERISLTFRNIGTFLMENETMIYGQGAVSKSKENARPVRNDADEAERMIWAFGKENHESDEFDWEKSYGYGFDVLHFKAKLPKLAYDRRLADTDIDRVIIKLALYEKGVEFEDEEVLEGDDSAHNGSNSNYITFTECDLDKTAVKGTIEILLYLETFYSGDPKLGSSPTEHRSLLPQPQRYERTAYANALVRLMESRRLKEKVEAYLTSLREAKKKEDASKEENAIPKEDNKKSEEDKVAATTDSPDTTTSEEKLTLPATPSAPIAHPTTPSSKQAKSELESALDTWESHLRQTSRSILGDTNLNTYLLPSTANHGEEAPMFSLADCALWPVLWELRAGVEVFIGEGEVEFVGEGEVGLDWETRFKRLDEYCRRVEGRASVRSVLGVQVDGVDEGGKVEKKEEDNAEKEQEKAENAEKLEKVGKAEVDAKDEQRKEKEMVDKNSTNTAAKEATPTSPAPSEPTPITTAVRSKPKIASESPEPGTSTEKKEASPPARDASKDDSPPAKPTPATSSNDKKTTQLKKKINPTHSPPSSQNPSQSIADQKVIGSK